MVQQSWCSARSGERDYVTEISTYCKYILDLILALGSVLFECEHCCRLQNRDQQSQQKYTQLLLISTVEHLNVIIIILL